MDHFIEDLLLQGESPVLTGVEVEGNPEAGSEKSNVEQTDPRTKLHYEGVAVFKGDKLLGWIDDDYTVGFNYVTDNVTKNTGHFKDETGSLIIIEALTSTTKRKVKIIDGEPHIYLSAETLCNVQEVEGADKLDTEAKIISLEEETEDRVVKRMKDAVEGITKQFNVDIFGFGQSIYRKSPKAWERLKERKGEGYLKTLPVHYEASVTINRIGTIDNSFYEDIKE